MIRRPPTIRYHAPTGGMVRFCKALSVFLPECGDQLLEIWVADQAGCLDALERHLERLGWDVVAERGIDEIRPCWNDLEGAQKK